ncbi:MAG: flagellar hook basal-body protein [Deltaproteobacteria bacterium]|nr:MAG: flagellar hook basal-body protein [Deltaproteobacteria bacterium]
MADGIYTALSGAVAQQTAMDVISNNLANVSTSGYKGDQVVFKEVLATVNPDATNVHSEVAELRHDFSQGQLHYTKNPLDAALMGPGFFVVDTPQGEKLSRQGSFRMRGDGMLQTVDGHLVMGQKGAIRLEPGAKVRMDSYGALFQTPQSQGSQVGTGGETLVDRLRVVDVAKPEGLRREGHGLWDPGDNELLPVATAVEPLALEQANVNPIKAMTQLIAVQRAYEQYNRTIEQIRSLEQKATGQLG